MPSLHGGTSASGCSARFSAQAAVSWTPCGRRTTRCFGSRTPSCYVRRTLFWNAAANQNFGAQESEAVVRAHLLG